MLEKKTSKKIDESLKIIEDSLVDFYNPCVCCSFGKDSILVLWLIRKIIKNVKVLFNNTGFEYPDTYIFKKRIVDEWNLDVEEIPPKHSFWWIVERHGFPFYSKGNIKKWDRKYLPSHYCCLYLRKRPFNQYLKKSIYDVAYDGLRRQESDLRAWSTWKYGVIHYNKKNDLL